MSEPTTASVVKEQAVDTDGYDPAPALTTSKLSFHEITERISWHTEKDTPWSWLAAFSVASMLLGVLAAMLAYQVWVGVGVWGLNVPVGWGWAIVNFVWWVGIGHAGTLISAILFLFRQDWRTSIIRSASRSRRTVPVPT